MYPVQAGSAFSSSTTASTCAWLASAGRSRRMLAMPDLGAVPVLAVHVRPAARIVADQDGAEPGNDARGSARTATRSAIALRISAAAALPSRICAVIVR